MERARKSFSALRQAASSRAAPTAPSGPDSSSLTSSPFSGNYEAESSNPLFDLARAAAPSSRMKIASDAISEGGKSNLTPPSGFHSTDMRGAPSSVASNPILSREIAGMKPSNGTAGGPTLAFGGDIEDDPSMNKPKLADDGKTGESRLQHLLHNPKQIVLVPARFIKEKTWGTPRRKACTSVCLLIFVIIFIYLIVKLVDALRILDSDPSIAEFKIADLCSNSFKMSVAADVLNPSGSGVTVRAMRSEVYLGNASIPDGLQLIGYIVTPDVYLGSGNVSLAVDFEAEIPLEQSPHVRKMIQDFIAGEELDARAKIPLTASFGAEVFIVPISYSTTLEINLKLPSLSNMTSSEDEEPVEDDDYVEPDLIKEIELPVPKSPAHYIVAKAALQLFGKKSLEKSFLEVTAPPIQFEVSLGGMPAVSGMTEFFHYGKKLPKEVPEEYLGTIRAMATAGEPNLGGVHYGLTAFQNKSTLPLKVVISNKTHPEITPYRTSANRECQLQKILTGLTIERDLDLEEMLAPAPPTSTTASPTPAPTASPYFELLMYELQDIDNNVVIKNRLGVDLTGLNQLYGLKGTIPTVQIYLETDPVEENDPKPSLILFDLFQSFSFYPNASLVDDLQFNLQLLSASHLIRIADDYLLGGYDVHVYVRTSNDPSASILSRLLSVVTLDLSIKDLMGSDEEEEEENSRRRLDATRVAIVETGPHGRDLQADLLANKTLKLEIESETENYFKVNVLAKGFDTSFFNGMRLMWKQTQVVLYLPDYNNPNVWHIQDEYFLYFNLLPYDTDTVDGTLSMEIFQGGKWSNANLQINEFIDAITTTYAPIKMQSRFNYNAKLNVGQPHLWPARVFTFKRTPPNEETENNSTSSGGAAPSASFLQLYHGELIEIEDNTVHANLHFAIDLNGINVNVTVPAINLAIGVCNKPHFIAISMDKWDFQTADVAAKAPLQVQLQDSTQLINTAASYVDGVTQDICIKRHPTQAGNYLSRLIGSLGFSLALPGRSKDAAPVDEDADLLDLTLTSAEREACLSLEFDLSSSNGGSNTSTSFGWGDVDFRLSTDYLTDSGEVLSVELNSGWYGYIDSYRQTNFYAPVASDPVSIRVCLLADAGLALDAAQGVTRSVFQRLYDGVAFDLGIGGTLKRRTPPVGQESVISGEFHLPANTLDSFISLGGATSIGGDGGEDDDDEEEDSFFSLNEVELVAFDGDEISIKITAEIGKIGFNVTLPPISVRVGRLETPGNLASEVQLFEVAVTIPSLGAGEQLPVPLSIAPIAPQDWGNTFELVPEILADDAVIVVGSSTNPSATLISHIIPTITFSLGDEEPTSPTAAPTPSTTSGPDSMDIKVQLKSSEVAASLLVDVKVLSRLSFKVIWGTIDCRLFDGIPGSSNQIGRLYIPSQMMQEIGSGPLGINLTLFGQATSFVRHIIEGSSTQRFGFDGSIGSSVFTSSLLIPESLTGFDLPEIEIGGNSDSSSGGEEEEESSFKLLDAAVLGANNVGLDGIFPCIFGDMCTNTIRGDNDVTFSGITGGATLGLDMPKLGSIRWQASLQSDIFLTVLANGYNLGKIAVRPISVNSTQTRLAPIASFLPNQATIPELRETVSAVLDGYDTVFTILGDVNENYFSNLLNSVEISISMSQASDEEEDPDAEPMMGEMSMQVVTTKRTEAIIDVTVPLLWDSDLVVSIGDLFATLTFGHTKTCGGFCQDGLQILTAESRAPLRLSPSPTYQPISVRGKIFHSGGVLNAGQKAIDDLISRFIWTREMPLELDARITPIAGNNYGATSPFTIKLYVTIPQGNAESSFIDDIEVDVLGTVTSSFGDITIKATKVLRNTMDFPLVVSYYQYVLKLADRDGVAEDGCSLISNSGLITSINPCSIPFLGLCYSPWDVPTPVGPIIASGDYNQLKPGTSILFDNQKYLMPGQTGSTELTIDSDFETSSRLVDEMLTKGTMCGDIANGIMVVALQANPNCNDAGKLEADIQCTYPIRVQFDLPNYPLSDLDSCGGAMEIPDYLGTTFYADGLEQYTAGTYSLLNPPGETVLLNGAVGAKATRSTSLTLYTEDSFQIEFQIKIVGCDNDPDDAGTAASLTFFTENQPTLTSPQITCNGNCNDVYASNNLGLSNNYASLVMAFRGCNALAWIVNGNVATPYRGSQSCGVGLDSGNWGTVIFTYNAHDKRASASYQVQSGIKRTIDFDLDLKAQLGDAQFAYMALVANGGDEGGVFSSDKCATVTYRNFVHRGPRTNGAKTTLEGGFSLFRVNEEGTIVFRARDDNGRRRGRGGNFWDVEVVDPATNSVVPNQIALGNQVVDNVDGTYTFHYKLATRGRYIVRVACKPGVAPDICNNANAMTIITQRLFVRA